MSQELGALQTRTTDAFRFISHTTNVLLFKFRCNIFIGVRIIKEIPGSRSEWVTVYMCTNGTPYITTGGGNARLQLAYTGHQMNS